MSSVGWRLLGQWTRGRGHVSVRRPGWGASPWAGSLSRCPCPTHFSGQGPERGRTGKRTHCLIFAGPRPRGPHSLPTASPPWTLSLSHLSPWPSCTQETTGQNLTLPGFGGR